MKLKLLLVSLLFFTLSLNLSNCQRKHTVDVIKVGTIAGPESELMEVGQKVAKKRYGLTIKIINFTDYTMLNEALNNGDLDANMFQHAPYLKAQIKQKGYKLTILGKGFVYP